MQIQCSPEWITLSESCQELSVLSHVRTRAPISNVRSRHNVAIYSNSDRNYTYFTVLQCRVEKIFDNYFQQSQLHRISRRQKYVSVVSLHLDLILF